MSRPVLIHAVLREGAARLPEAASPVAGGELALIAGPGLTALVSLLPEDAGEELFAEPDVAAALSLRHHELLTALATVADVAPVRLGALHADVTAVAMLLAEQAEVFKGALARIGGAQEFAVKLTPLTEASVAAPEPPATGRSFLLRRAEAANAKRNAGEAARAAATATFELLRAHATGHAFASPRRHAQADQEKRLIDAALLVPRDGTAAFAAAVLAAQEKAEASGYRLSVRGPLPAYSFVAEAA